MSGLSTDIRFDERIEFMAPRGFKQELRQAAIADSAKLSEFIRAACREKLNARGGR